MKKLLCSILMLFIIAGAFLYAEEAKKKETGSQIKSGMTSTAPGMTKEKTTKKKDQTTEKKTVVKKKVVKKKEEKKISLISEKKDLKPEELLENVYQFYRTARNLKISYTQKVKKPDPAKKPKKTKKPANTASIKSNGKIFAERHFYANWTKLNYRLIWEIENPVNYKIVTNRKRVWLYNPISQIVQIQSFKQMNTASQFISNLLLGRIKLREKYTATRSLENKYKLELTAKKKKEDIQKLSIQVNPIQYWAENISIETKNGTKYQMAFHSMTSSLPEFPEMEVFNKRNQFIIPRGVIIAR